MVNVIDPLWRLAEANSRKVFVSWDGVNIELEWKDLPPEIMEWAQAQAVAAKLSGNATQHYFGSGDIVMYE